MGRSNFTVRRRLYALPLSLHACVDASMSLPSLASCLQTVLPMILLPCNFIPDAIAIDIECLSVDKPVTREMLDGFQLRNFDSVSRTDPF